MLLMILICIILFILWCMLRVSAMASRYEKEMQRKHK